MKTKDVKELTKKVKAFLLSVWGRRELLTDAIGIFCIVVLMTGIPSFYKQIENPLLRVILAVILFLLLLAAAVLVIIRVIRRNQQNKPQKTAYIHALLRGLIVMPGIWVFSAVMVNTIHPSLSGIYAIEMSGKEEAVIMLSNSLFFALYSQALITILTGIEEKTAEFVKRLLKTWLFTILPLFGMSLLFTAAGEWLRNYSTALAAVINAAATTFLWVTAIAFNERVKRG